MRLTRARIHGYIDEEPAPGVLVYAFVVAALAFVFWLDRVTASSPLQHLYYVPIIVAGLFIGTRAALIASVAAVVLYHLANPALITMGYTEPDIVQVVLFVAVGAVTARLAEDARRLRRLAATDDLTGLHNLRSFEAWLATLLRDAHAANAPLSMLVLDLDRLKLINDVYGHLAGAEAVRTVGLILAARLPPEAVACRYGGDEFAVALPGYTSGGALALADDLCRYVAGVAPALGGISFATGTLSISVGVASLPVDVISTDVSVVAYDESAEGEALFKAADRALYVAKSAGRNRASAI